MAAGPAGTAAGAAKNPPPAPSADDAAVAAQGKELFNQVCQQCHGENMASPGVAVFDLRKFPHEDRARFFNSVTKGKGKMPPWGDILKPEEIVWLWAYIRTGG